MKEAQREFTLASMSMNTTAVEEALMSPAVSFEFKTSLKNIMSVMVPKDRVCRAAPGYAIFSVRIFRDVGRS